jgi:hypothetical protein
MREAPPLAALLPRCNSIAFWSKQSFRPLLPEIQPTHVRRDSRMRGAPSGSSESCYCCPLARRSDSTAKLLRASTLPGLGPAPTDFGEGTQLEERTASSTRAHPGRTRRGCSLRRSTTPHTSNRDKTQHWRYGHPPYSKLVGLWWSPGGTPSTCSTWARVIPCSMARSPASLMRFDGCRKRKNRTAAAARSVRASVITARCRERILIPRTSSENAASDLPEIQRQPAHPRLPLVRKGNRDIRFRRKQRQRDVHAELNVVLIL